MIIRAIAGKTDRSRSRAYVNALEKGILALALRIHADIIQHNAVAILARRFKCQLISRTLLISRQEHRFRRPTCNRRGVLREELPSGSCVHAVVHAQSIKKLKARYLRMREFQLWIVSLSEIHCRALQPRLEVGVVSSRTNSSAIRTTIGV